eukprot:551215_1
MKCCIFFIRILKEYERFLCHHIMEQPLSQFVEFCCYPKIALFVRKLISQSEEDLQGNLVQVIKEFNGEYQYITEWCGKLFVNIYEKTQSKLSITLICDSIKNHRTFKTGRWNWKPNAYERILNEVGDEIQRKNMNDLDILEHMKHTIKIELR